MRYTFPLLVLAVAGCSARPPAAPAASLRTVLMDADRAFAAATATGGLDAWTEAFADDAARLQMGQTAVRGRAAIRTYDADLFANPGSRIVWTPTDAGAFADGRHGFTTGTATLLSAAGDTLYAGVYLTMWRLEPDGRWRVILDTGADA